MERMDTHADASTLWGRDLRYVLTCHLVEAGAVLTVAQLVRAVAGDGFGLPRPANKAVSDALRWEVARGRVLRVGRGRYRSGVMPKATKSRIGTRVRSLRRDAFAETRNPPPVPR
jgi:hypothetical protein